MNLGALLGQKEDPLEHRAHSLMDAAHFVANDSLELKLRLKIGGFTKADVEWWRFFVIVAFIFTASTRLRNLKFNSRREERLMEILAAEFQRWHPRAYDAFEHCKAFWEKHLSGQEAVHTGDEERFASSDTIGAWVTANIVDHLPETEEERRLVREIGILIVGPAYHAWEV